MIDIEDENQLLEYLYGKFPELRSGKRKAPACSVRILTGGVSNRTVRVDLPSGRSWVLKQALDKLRVPIDWYCSPDRIHREALGMQLLRPLLRDGTIPALIFEDRENNLIAMSAVNEPFENWKTMLLAGRIDPRHVHRFARILSKIHADGVRIHDGLPRELFDLTYFWNLRLEPYYRYTGERVPAAGELFRELIEGYEGARSTLVHGDYSPKNILIRRNRPILLDHEVIHYGDPAFDLGFSLTHFLSKAHHLVRSRARFLQEAEEFWEGYLGGLSRAVRRSFAPNFEQRVVHHLMGCLLARAAGRSQLEYLSEDEKQRQVEAVTGMLARKPVSVGELILRFGAEIGVEG
jgi:tRNA A-37 threonylcarbamoyl transferase component Bud32